MLPYMLVGVVIAVVVYMVVRALSAARAGEFKCSTCRHCRKLFDDGSLCGYGSREVFKNAVHIANCTDYKKK